MEIPLLLKSVVLRSSGSVALTTVTYSGTEPALAQVQSKCIAEDNSWHLKVLWLRESVQTQMPSLCAWPVMASITH